MRETVVRGGTGRIKVTNSWILAQYSFIRLINCIFAL